MLPNSRQQTNTAWNFANKKPSTSNAVFGEIARGAQGCDVLND